MRPHSRPNAHGAEAAKAGVAQMRDALVRSARWRVSEPSDRSSSFMSGAAASLGLAAAPTAVEVHTGRSRSDGEGGGNTGGAWRVFEGAPSGGECATTHAAAARPRSRRTRKGTAQPLRGNVDGWCNMLRAGKECAVLGKFTLSHKKKRGWAFNTRLRAAKACSRHKQAHALLPSACTLDGVASTKPRPASARPCACKAARKPHSSTAAGGAMQRLW